MNAAEEIRAMREEVAALRAEFALLRLTQPQTVYHFHQPAIMPGYPVYPSYPPYYSGTPYSGVIGMQAT